MEEKIAYVVRLSLSIKLSACLTKVTSLIENIRQQRKSLHAVVISSK